MKHIKVSPVFIWPTILVMIGISIYPSVLGFAVSLFDWVLGIRFKFVGFHNYVKLFHNSDFYKVLYNTLRFTFIACTLEVAFGFYLAVQVNKLKIESNIIRGFLMTPLMIAGIIVALMSKVLFDPQIGSIYYLFQKIGFKNFAFYGAANTAMGTIIAVDIWWQTAFIFIILLAGLQSIPNELLEASYLEGASEFSVFWRIKFPLLKDLLISIIIFRLIDVLKIFDLVFGTTGGGPNLSTEVFQTYAYRNAFTIRDIGYSMTIIVVFTFIMLLLSFLLNKIKEK